MIFFLANRTTILVSSWCKIKVYTTAHTQKRVKKRVEIMAGIKALMGFVMNAIASANKSMPVDAITNEAREEAVTAMIPAMK